MVELPAEPHGAVDWPAVARPGFGGPVIAPTRIVGPIPVLPLVCFLAVAALAGSAKPSVAVEVLGPLDVGFVPAIAPSPFWRRFDATGVACTTAAGPAGPAAAESKERA